MKSRVKLLIIIMFAYILIPYSVNASSGESLYDVIKEQAVMDNIKSTYVNSDSGIDFTKISSDTNGKGVYELSSTKDDNYPVYYYRGNVTNNNLLFANFCWKMVRTTDKGGIKLIYNGTPVDGSCANSGSSIGIGKSPFNDLQGNEAYVGYMTSELVNGAFSGNYDNAHDSTIKKVVDEWYKNNMLDYTDELEDAIFCSDRSKSISDNSYFGIHDRINNGTPSLECKNDLDKYTVSTENGNGALKYPVGLLTYDEDMYAGGKSGAVNDQYYLFDMDGYYAAFWSMTPYDIGYYGSLGNMAFAAQAHYYSPAQLICYWGVRPVIAIENNGIVVSGDGTETKPYILGKKYAITTAEDYDNIHLDKNYAIAGELVRINIIDLNNYDIKEVIVTDSLGNRINVDNYSFEMPDSDVVIKLILNKKIDETDNGSQDNNSDDMNSDFSFRKISKPVENPQTDDKVINYFIILFISTLIFCGFLKTKRSS